jgi:hypothetical protein
VVGVAARRAGAAVPAVGRAVPILTGVAPAAGTAIHARGRTVPVAGDTTIKIGARGPPPPQPWAG